MQFSRSLPSPLPLPRTPRSQVRTPYSVVLFFLLFMFVPLTVKYVLHRRSDAPSPRFFCFCKNNKRTIITPQGSRLRAADEYMCTAVANIYACNLHVHTKLGVTKYEPFKGIAYCTIHLAFYSASDWKHYRSTRKIISPPTSPGPAISDLHPADAGPLSRVSSGSANADPQVNLHALIAKNLHPRCQQRTSPRTCPQAHRSGPFARESP